MSVLSLTLSTPIAFLDTRTYGFSNKSLKKSFLSIVKITTTRLSWKNSLIWNCRLFLLTYIAWYSIESRHSYTYCTLIEYFSNAKSNAQPHNLSLDICCRQTKVGFPAKSTKMGAAFGVLLQYVLIWPNLLGCYWMYLLISRQESQFTEKLYLQMLLTDYVWIRI